MAKADTIYRVVCFKTSFKSILTHLNVITNEKVHRIIYNAIKRKIDALGLILFVYDKDNKHNLKTINTELIK